MSVLEDVRLDKNQLDVESEKQSELMYEYSLALSDASRSYADMKLALDALVSEKKLTWRSAGEISINGKIAKVTEGALDNAVDIAEDVMELRKKLIEQQYQVDMLKGIVESLRNKKSSIENEITLFLSGYFGAPNDQRSLMKAKQNA
jgi:ABC-type phosphate transport system auxiliary subunit